MAYGNSFGKWFRWLASLAALILSASTTDADERSGPANARDPGIEIHFRESGPAESSQVLVTGLTGEQLLRLRAEEIDTAGWQRFFRVTVGANRGSDARPMLGKYSVGEDRLVFEPAFPLRRGVRYTAIFQPGELPAVPTSNVRDVKAEIFLPRSTAGPATRVSAVYPSLDVLPENLLKFYLHFSAPMSRGEAYRRVRLYDDNGELVEYPFLELGEELWNPEGTRFTLYFDPGRIKRGLKPRELFGPALEEGRSYTLVIDAGWPDAQGRPLAKSIRKEFRVAAPDETQPNTNRWEVGRPAAGTRDPLVVEFAEPLDHAMLMRVIDITDPNGQPIAGQVTLSKQETVWSFHPVEPWRPGDYHLNADSALEDLAGNSLGRPFEVDLFKTVDRRIRRETVRLPFQIAPR